MTVYKYFTKIALRNKGVILTYTLIFFILSILNGSGTIERETSFMEKRLNIGIIDNCNSELSRGLKNYLEKKNDIIDTMPDEEYIKEQIFLETVDAVIIIPEDFDEKVINKENSIKVYNDDRKIESMQIQNQINKFLTFANATYENGEFNLEDLEVALNEEANVELIKPKNKMANEGVANWFKYYYNFTSYVIMAIYISAIGLVMADFKDENIESRMKISSKKFLKFNMEMYLGQLTMASMITLIFIVGSIVLKGKYIGEVNFGKYVLNTVVFSLSALCFTFLINNVTRNKFVINAMATVFSLGTSFISGVMVPQQFLSEKTLMIAKFFPTYYFVRVNEMTVNSFSDMRFEILMQLLFGAVFLLMGLYFSKTAQQA
ncbi:ABC transporter permease [Sporanaerobacter acetigenes]|uniref:ABC-2 type transport system permease protein n=1 Tax=Sporanaerobacter acetigenes DSM 13106 TaxID=1123281 RepID=A0A1M5YVJ5_9FIRM|nr:ABC transporter permease [Sporanaerobacter acetigenes]SHI16031.1 ABC-2 type transport system permease protein [Sporanaerobacter acetigenes DSM 13106]